MYHNARVHSRIICAKQSVSYQSGLEPSSASGIANILGTRRLRNEPVSSIFIARRLRGMNLSSSFAARPPQSEPVSSLFDARRLRSEPCQVFSKPGHWWPNIEHFQGFSNSGSSESSVYEISGARRRLRSERCQLFSKLCGPNRTCS